MGEKFGSVYEYAANNPISYVDPSGLRALTPGERQFVRDNFGNCLDPDQIQLHGAPWDNGGSLSAEWQIYIPKEHFVGGDPSNGLDLSNPGNQGLFAHELAHALQQNVFTGLSILAPGLGLSRSTYYSVGLGNLIQTQAKINNPYDLNKPNIDVSNLETQAQAIGMAIQHKNNPNAAESAILDAMKALCNCGGK